MKKEDTYFSRAVSISPPQKRQHIASRPDSRNGLSETTRISRICIVVVYPRNLACVSAGILSRSPAVLWVGPVLQALCEDGILDEVGCAEYRGIGSWCCGAGGHGGFGGRGL